MGSLVMLGLPVICTIIRLLPCPAHLDGYLRRFQPIAAPRTELCFLSMLSRRDGIQQAALPRRGELMVLLLSRVKPPVSVSPDYAVRCGGFFEMSNFLALELRLGGRAKPRTRAGGGQHSEGPRFSSFHL